MEHRHNLLKRQLKRHFGDSFSVPAEWQKFISSVNEAYSQFDIDRGMLERSLDLSSQELLHANSEMGAIIQAFPDLLFRIDMNGKILDFKAGSKADLFTSRRHLVGKHLQDTPSQEVSRKFQDAINAVFQRKTIISIEYSLRKKGKEFFYEARLLPLIDHQIIVIIRNITNLKRAEEALKTSEEKFRTLVENINIGVYRATGDDRGSFIQANPAIMKMFGFDSMEEFMKISVSDLYIDHEQRTHFLDELKKNGYIKDKELRMMKKDGMPIWTSCTANIKYDEHGAIQWIDGVIEDATERKKIEEQLRQAQKMDAIGTLAGGVAHDFNNILTAIMGYGNLLKEDVKKDKHLDNYANQILAAAEKAAFLTQSLLAFGRKQIFNLRPVNVNEIVRKMETLLHRVIGEDIELKTFLTSRGVVVMADSSQLEQVLMNLAVNARDAMPDGGSLTIETETVLLDNEFISAHGFGNVGYYALITVEDSGHGMDEKTQSRIFEPFFTTKEIGKGTGLGLSMVYGIIKQHDGYINVYSETGKGSIFRIYLPLVESETEEIESEAVYTPPEGGTETILVAEDNLEVRRFIRHILERSGYTVIEAVDGEDALEKFLRKGDSIQLLVLDVIMPQKSGKEVYEEIIKIRPDIKVIFTSGYTAEIIHRKGILEKGLNFISKPVSPDKLLRKVRETLKK
jgi:PAS domain S-box-containing protein